METSYYKLFADYQAACTKNRTFPRCELIDEFEKLLPRNVQFISEGTILYRSRVFCDNFMEKFFESAKKSATAASEAEINEAKQSLEKIQITYQKNQADGFRGYAREDSFVNTNISQIRDGRCNHSREICLYAAGDVRTSIAELKPLIRECISVAKILVKEELRLIDLRFLRDGQSDLLELVSSLFIASPTVENENAYIYSQVICDIIKKNGYDGVIYSSCQNLLGENYAIFNYGKCEAVSSERYRITQIDITSEHL